MLAERASFIEAVRSVRLRMIEEEKEKQCVKAAVTGLSLFNGLVGAGAIAASATGVGLIVMAAGGLIYLASKPIDKLGNHLNLAGEQYLWQHTDIKSWVVRAWEAGYPVGQILSAYSDFCEEVQLSNPQARRRIATAPGFVRALNRSADQFSGLPSVARVGEVRGLPMPLEDDAHLPLPAPEPEAPAIPADILAKIAMHQAKAITPAQPEPSPWDAPAEELPKPNPIEETRAYAERQVTELNRQEAVATVVREKSSKIEEFDFINDVATASGEPWPKSIMWLGPSRSGKSWAMAASLQESVWHWESLGQTVGVWWVSAKHDPDEHKYAHGRGYQACSEVQVDELERNELEDTFGEWYDLLREFITAKQFDKRFFIFDEMNLAASLCTPNPKSGFQPGPMASKFWQTLISQAISCSSNGRGQGKALWLAAQMSSMQSLGLSTDQCGVFHEQLVFMAPTDAGSQFEKGALRNGFVSEKLDPYHIKKGETGRFYHYQGRWRGLPVINMPEKSR